MYPGDRSCINGRSHTCTRLVRVPMARALGDIQRARAVGAGAGLCERHARGAGQRRHAAQAARKHGGAAEKIGRALRGVAVSAAQRRQDTAGHPPVLSGQGPDKGAGAAAIARRRAVQWVVVMGVMRSPETCDRWPLLLLKIKFVRTSLAYRQLGRSAHDHDFVAADRGLTDRLSLQASAPWPAQAQLSPRGSDRTQRFAVY